MNEIKNSLEVISSRITEAEEWISDLEDKIVAITTAEQNKEKDRIIYMLVLQNELFVFRAQNWNGYD